ncbi:enoyl-CoA hydratase/isomerase family protein [Robiginitalea sp. M366]|uniref:enoyl-CoA hydratase/isomerase family protein n=1 Tax=Robiginitalea aestuariiviva TaxID=3036903 RepID=UPI00240DD555|nr:enoyl-CoA hydratase/isomerase family protein [Robiginitalea aestuariiviva]MDG1571593.1 enoyl-CoA hydratase/isomerase family protein [Robiginitalea aestuariiviva]
MATSRSQGSLYTRIQGSLALVEFGHPSSNAMNSELLDRLEQEIRELGTRKDLGVILLLSEGDRAFCAGASFDELLAVSTEEESRQFFSGFARVILAMKNCPKPIVTLVQGKAVGGGVGLIAASDYALACEAASVRLSELSIGIAPLVIAPAVARKTGAAGLAEMSLSPKEWKSAYWAKDKGLFARVYESQKELRKEGEAFASALAETPVAALEAMKAALWEGTGHWEELLPARAEQTGKLALSDTTQRQLKAFKSKS